MNRNHNPILIVFIFVVGLIILGKILSSASDAIRLHNDKSFRLLSSESNSLFDEALMKYADSEDINLEIDHYGDLEMIDILNNGEEEYDGVWISNSIWLYMLDNSYLVTDSKSIAIDPVVMAVKKSKAQELGFIDKDVYNKDIFDAISSKKLKYVMTSVTQTNTGATAYLGLISSMAGSPEVLTSDMLKDDTLKNNLKEFFKGVSRVSGDESYLDNMFINGDYEAVINYESSLIKLNKQLEQMGREPLYLIYPKDGVAINDMPFAYVSRGQSDLKKENFKKLQSFLRSESTRKELANEGFRSWYGGVNNEAPSNVFNKDWGIDTNEYLVSFKYPSKTVMNEAFDLYVDVIRKPTHVVFVLDISGSMDGTGISELKDAMNYVLDKEQAKKDRLQFSNSDKVTIITFNSEVCDVTNTYTGSDTTPLISFVNNLYAQGGTNIYDSSIRALKLLKNDNSDEYMKTIILMTDGRSNYGTYSSLTDYYRSLGQDIPIYSITFGNAEEYELNNIARLTNGKVFDGKSGLKKAFEEVRSYN